MYITLIIIIILLLDVHMHASPLPLSGAPTKNCNSIEILQLSMFYHMYICMFYHNIVDYIISTYHTWHPVRRPDVQIGVLFAYLYGCLACNRTKYGTTHSTTTEPLFVFALLIEGFCNVEDMTAFLAFRQLRRCHRALD